MMWWDISIKKRGDVFIVRNYETLDTKENHELMSKDIIITGDSAKARIKFKDGTLVTVGKNSIFEIENYVYDKSKNSDIKLRAKHGFFSAVSGEISKVAPEKFSLRTKTATIGIRGTAFEGEVSPTKESVACTKGAITVTAKGKTIVVKEGESLEIKEELFKAEIDVVGKVVSIKGVVFIIRDRRTFIADIGLDIKPSDKIVTSYDSEAQIELIDNSYVNILNNSATLVDYQNGGEIINALKGAVELVSINNSKKFLHIGEKEIIRSGKW
jgi:ferric-dicitrate binding protein FerR (iron transport regulator)